MIHTPASERRLLIAGTLFLTLSLMSAAWILGGCAASKSPSAASVNQTITTVIADAGTVAIAAEQQYNAGQLPQTDAVRTAINDLGNSYNEAHRLWMTVLQAEQLAQQAQSQQIAACSPPSTAPTQATATSATTTCSNATQAAQTAQVAATTAQANLSNSVNTLVTKTQAVKALQPGK